jgi:sugar lactone lactonase YvrE
MVASVAPPVEGSDWLTSDPIPWGHLRGRVVILVFWSFACEASLVRVREVESLVARAGAGVNAIAVHTPRYPFEDELANVRSAVGEHQIAIPVVHDPEGITWNRYNPEGWPATAVIDGRGKVLGMQAGTGPIGPVSEAVAVGLQTLSSAVRRTEGLVDVHPARAPPLPDTDLAYPTSVAVRASGELVVADHGHHRLLVFELSSDLRRASAVVEIDGFDRPRTVVADRGEGIYVTEPVQGSVSYLDLQERTRRLLTSDLVAPTSLAIDRDDSLVVADGGGELIYRIVNNGPHDVTIGVIAGSGVTGCRDGDGGEAELAQPCGLARTEVGLVFCDAGSSNIRLLTDAGRVATITGNGFFEWGLVDGPAHKALLQRPSDLAVLDDGSIVIVDTGNNRLRRLANRRIRTLGLAGLHRPSGVCGLPGGKLLVADTGNHRLVVVDADLQTAWPLTLEGVLPPRDLDDLDTGDQPAPAGARS